MLMEFLCCVRLCARCVDSLMSSTWFLHSGLPLWRMKASITDYVWPWVPPLCARSAFSPEGMESGPNLFPPSGLAVVSSLELMRWFETFLRVETRLSPPYTPIPAALQCSYPAPLCWKTFWGIERQATPNNSYSPSSCPSLPLKKWITYSISIYN